MNTTWIIILSCLSYLGILFFLASKAENSTGKIRKWVHSPWAYTLSLAIYCSAWTFYGSIGRAVNSGPDFLAIYLGPTIAMPVFWLIGRKMIAIIQSQRINSIADFISSRYGKSRSLGALVAIVCLLGITPYIALQIKAISQSISVVTDMNPGTVVISIVVTALLAIFTLIFGTRYLDVNRPKYGVIAAVSFESLFKLFAFLIGAIFVVYFLFSSPLDILNQYELSTENSSLFHIDSGGAYVDWLGLLLVSALAIFLLPRQFQVSFVENRNINHLKHATTWFPLYLFIINLFIVPIALAGLIKAAPTPDFYLLSLAQEGGVALTILVFLGGFSAATSMIIVSSLALGNMVSTHLVTPFFIARSKQTNFGSRLIWLRRISIIVVFVLAYLYQETYRKTPLVSIGIVSFIAIAQLGPAALIGLYWKGGKRAGAMIGIIAGTLVVNYLLIYPDLQHAGINLGPAIPFHQYLGLSPVGSAVILSLGANLTGYYLGSVYSNERAIDLTQSELFVNFDGVESGKSGSFWTGKAFFPDLKSLLVRFLGDRRTEQVLDRYARINNINWKDNTIVDAPVISMAERLLADAIGPASARIMVSNVLTSEEISLEEVVNILDEKKEALQLNKTLQLKQEELQKATDKLKSVNEQLVHFSQLKDDFLYTVTHELRTPLTSIRAQAEILLDIAEMTRDEQEQFLNNIVSDCERLTRLISNVLDLEKFEAGNQTLDISSFTIRELLDAALHSVIHKNQKKAQFNTPTNALDEIILADFDKLTQVLINLISNALKFIPEEEGKVSLEVEHTPDGFHFYVRDNGPGIPDEDQKFIFDKFFQAKHQLSKKPTGSGLGLAISKNIVQLHGGMLKIEYSSHLGTSFLFNIPQQQVPLA